MTVTTDNRFLVSAWGASLALHSLVIVLAMLFVSKVRPVFQEEPFKWDVALVESSKLEPAPEPAAQPAPAPAESVRQPAPTPVPALVPRRVGPPSETLMHRVAPRQTAQMVHPEPAKPVEQRKEPPPVHPIEAPAPVAKPLQEKPVEPVERQVIEAAKPKSEPLTAEDAEPLQTAEPVIADRQPTASLPPEPTVSRAEPTVSRPVETPAAPSVQEPVASLSHAEPAPPIASPANPPAHEAAVPAATAAPGPASQEAPMQTAKTGAPGPEVKTDHRWLAESLWRRVAELKRYPSSARLNGQEGKVVLKAVIRSDGHLIEVTVQKSSGHQILDAAAMEAVKLACPLHMKHAINKPEIVVSLPIVYSLAN
ncbi:MAG TPA: TonB family protein [Nitrospira sp.]|jgi:periplasmic protein TonB|nr:TonB family protein [Nitrospira sp.]